MTRTSFARLVHKIQSGDNSAFEWLLGQCGEKCVTSLVKNAGCSNKEAEEVLMDALFHFRERVFQGKITYVSNILRYMKGKCWSIWKEKLLEKERLNPIKSKVIRAFYDASQSGSDPMDWNEMELELEVRFQRQLEATQRALSFLDKRKRRLLTLFYINKRKPNEIAAIMGFQGSEMVSLAKTDTFKQLMEQTEFHMATENG